MGKKLLQIAWFLVAVIAALSPGVAKADQTWDFLQITCVPELNYFSLHTVAIEKDKFVTNETELANKLHLLDSQEHMISPQALLKQPYTCNLPDYPAAHISAYSLTVKIADYVPVHLHGECGGLEQFNVVIELDGTEVRRFPAFGINRCGHPETHLLEADALHLLDCAIAKYPSPNQKTTEVSCERITLKR